MANSVFGFLIGKKRSLLTLSVLAEVAAGKVCVVDSRRNRQPLAENQIHADELLKGSTRLEDILSGRLQVILATGQQRATKFGEMSASNSVILKLNYSLRQRIAQLEEQLRQFEEGFTNCIKFFEMVIHTLPKTLFDTAVLNTGEI